MTNFIKYDLQTHFTDTARPYVFCFCQLNKLAGNYDRNLSPYEIDKCKKDAIAFRGDDCVTKSLDFYLKLKGEGKRDNANKFLEYNLQLHAHNGSGFDTWITLNILPCDKRIVNKNKKEKDFLN